jgi:hypothetical protein
MRGNIVIWGDHIIRGKTYVKQRSPFSGSFIRVAKRSIASIQKASRSFMKLPDRKLVHLAKRPELHTQDSGETDPNKMIANLILKIEQEVSLLNRLHQVKDVLYCLEREFERTQPTFVRIVTFSNTVICIGFYHVIVTFAAQRVPPCAHCAIQYTPRQEEECSNGSKGESTQQKKPTGKKAIKVVEIGAEEDECQGVE